MLPPISPAVLDQNPKFRALYKDLSTNKLNEDATTKDPKKQRIQDDLAKALTKARIAAAQRSIILDHLRNISLNALELPIELREVIQIVCAQLSSAIPEDDHQILTDDIDYFLENIDPIATALSTALSTTATHLHQIANPQSPSSADTTPTPLPALISTLQSTQSTLTHSLHTARQTLADLLTTTLLTHRTLLTHLIRIHEFTLHGSLPRHVRAHAEHLAAVAQGMELKLTLAAHPRNLANDGELEAALISYGKVLGKRKGELVAQRTGLERVLRGYESEGRGVRELAGRWAELKAEERRVKGEIEEVGRARGEE